MEVWTKCGHLCGCKMLEVLAVDTNNVVRGLSLSECIVGLELRLYSHPNKGKDPENLRAIVEQDL